MITASRGHLAFSAAVFATLLVLLAWVGRVVAQPEHCPGGESASNIVQDKNTESAHIQVLKQLHRGW